MVLRFMFARQMRKMANGGPDSTLIHRRIAKASAFSKWGASAANHPTTPVCAKQTGTETFQGEIARQDNRKGR